jgi:hypothetical protein
MKETCCDRCLDWWIRGVTKPKIYPIQPESFRSAIKNYPAVELSFGMIFILLYPSKIGLVPVTLQKLRKGG